MSTKMVSLGAGHFQDVIGPTESEENLIVDAIRRIFSSGFPKLLSYDGTDIRFYIKLLLELLPAGLGISMLFRLSSTQVMEPIKVSCWIITRNFITTLLKCSKLKKHEVVDLLVICVPYCTHPFLSQDFGIYLLEDTPSLDTWIGGGC